MASPRLVAEFPIPAQLLFIAIWFLSPTLASSGDFLFFIWNYVILLDAFLDILCKFFCLYIIVPCVLVRFLHNDQNNIICFSSRNYFDHQLLSHGRTGNGGLHHKICTFLSSLFLSFQLSFYSSHQPWCSSSSFFLLSHGLTFQDVWCTHAVPFLKIIDQ